MKTKQLGHNLEDESNCHGSEAGLQREQREDHLGSGMVFGRSMFDCFCQSNALLLFP